MSLAVFENYLDFAERVVRAKGDLPSAVDGAELESVLVSHGVVMLYAHMERCFQKAIEIKCQRCADLEVRAFALSVKDEKTGKIKMEAIKGTLKRFGIDHKNGFSVQLEAASLSDTWDSIANQRALVAHYGEPAKLTLSELRTYYAGIRNVLGLICHAMSLSSTDVANISALIVLPQATAATSTPSGAP